VSGKEEGEKQKQEKKYSRTMTERETDIQGESQKDRTNRE
jgi:hypothetical protein